MYVLRPSGARVLVAVVFSLFVARARAATLQWRQLTADAAFGKRVGMSVAVFQGEMYVMAGRRNATLFADVWSSSNGYTWNEGQSPSWSRRAHAAAVVLGPRLLVLGGCTSPAATTALFPSNDVYQTVDGNTWTQISSAAWLPRFGHTAAQFNGNVFVSGGVGRRTDGRVEVFADVWYSANAHDWTQLHGTSSVRLGRLGAALHALNGRLVLAGGAFLSQDLPPAMDAWAVSDGSGGRPSAILPRTTGGAFFAAAAVASGLRPCGATWLPPAFAPAPTHLSLRARPSSEAPAARSRDAPFLPVDPTQYCPPGAADGSRGLLVVLGGSDAPFDPVSVTDLPSAAGLARAVFTANGANWSALPTPPWSGRAAAGAVSFGGRLFVLAGGTGDGMADASADVWVLEQTRAPGGAPRRFPLAKTLVACGAALALAAALALVARWHRRRGAAKHGTPRQRLLSGRSGGGGGGGAASPGTPQIAARLEGRMRELGGVDWLIPFAALSVGDQVAAGSTGAVYRGHFAGATVALKQIFVSRWDDSRFEESFVAEASLLSRLNHPNIVRMYGVSYSLQYLYIVTEFCPFTVRDLYTDPGADAAQLRAAAHQVCAGMAFLHSRDVLHRDIKPDNVLVSTAGHAKLCDFGVSRLMDDAAAAVSLTGQIGTPAFMAPEVLREQRGQYSGGVDVFSFGVLLWCFVCRAEPYEGLEASPLQFALQVVEGLRPDIPDFVPSPLATLMRQCWSDNPHERPTFSELAAALASEDAGGDPALAFPDVRPRCRGALRVMRRTASGALTSTL